MYISWKNADYEYQILRTCTLDFWYKTRRLKKYDYVEYLLIRNVFYYHSW